MTSIERVDPPLVADEAAMLLAFLDYHRDTLRMKTDALSAEQLGRTLAPSTMTLGGMLKHLALVEDYWFSVMLMGNDDAAPWNSVDWNADRDWEWHTAVDDDPAVLHGLFDEAVTASGKYIAQALDEGGLDRLSVRESRHDGGGHFSLRWILMHMVEEYARHNGHADLIRESIDGATGE